MPTKHQQLYQLLYEWTVEETCDYCKHLATWSDGKSRHPCHHCECYDMFAISPVHHADLQEKVKQILKIVNSKTSN